MKSLAITIKSLALLAVILLSFIMLVNVSNIFPSHFNIALPFIITFIIYSLLYVFLLRKKLSFTEIFLHEFTHLIFALLTFKRVKGFFVEKQSGYLSYQGGKDFIVLLSPYFFPILLFSLIMISFSLDKENLIFVKYVVVVLYASFLLKVALNWSFNEQDIRECGRLYAFVFIVCMQIILFVAVCDFIFQDFTNFEYLFSTDFLDKLK